MTGVQVEEMWSIFIGRATYTSNTVWRGNCVEMTPVLFAWELIVNDVCKMTIIDHGVHVFLYVPEFE